MENKKVLLALALSFIVLGLYPTILEQFYPGYQQRTKSTQKVEAPGAAPAAALATADLAVSQFQEKPLPLAIEEDLLIENDVLKLTFSKKAGVVREASLKKYTDPETGEPLKLFSALDQKEAPFDARFLENDLEFSVEKSLELDPSRYGGKLRVVFRNLTGRPQKLRYALSGGKSLAPRDSIDSQYIESNFYGSSGEKSSIRHIKETGRGKMVQSVGPVEWIAVKDRHFSVVIKPVDAGSAFSGVVEGLGEHRNNTSLLSPSITVPGNGTQEHVFQIYIGPNVLEDLEPYGLSPIVNFGKLDGIGKILVGSLELLHKIFRNYGLAIIALTILINLILFPLTRQSYMSMKRMQLIQPQMAKLREHNKKNPEKLNREMMELYKKHKVNPFGGCLPLVIQMPVFIALYVALSKSVILINEPFLWVKDLSTPDNLPIGIHLPFIGDHIHLLPLIMAVGMVFQQKLTQVKMEGQDPAMEAQQKMMAVMMPILFGFLFYSMPSGLVLYWLTNTLLMTLYQLRLKKMTLA